MGSAPQFSLFSFLRSLFRQIPAARHKTHRTQKNKMTTDWTEKSKAIHKQNIKVVTIYS